MLITASGNYLVISRVARRNTEAQPAVFLTASLMGHQAVIGAPCTVLARSRLSRVVVVIPEQFFGVVEGVDSGLSAIQAGWWDPFNDPVALQLQLEDAGGRP